MKDGELEEQVLQVEALASEFSMLANSVASYLEVAEDPFEPEALQRLNNLRAVMEALRRDHK